jgi:glyoxylase-like metal-dependent hydrolase (beta-lactamase superfamily II)
VRELQTGLWHWEAPHPDWKPGEEWDQMVSSYAIDDGRRLLLFDPLAMPNDIEELAADRESAIVLTCPWHERDARRLIEELGAPVFTPRPDEGSGDAAWLDTVEAHQFSAGDRLPVGVGTFPGLVANDIVLWVEGHRAVIAGDTLIDRGQGLEIPEDWLGEGVTREQVAEGLRPLLELPVEHVLATHGGPADRTALERALARATRV